MASASNGAWIGLAFGVLSFAFVAVARLLVPEVRGRPDALSLPILALLYFVVGPSLGFLGGAMRTWLPGRVGSVIIAATICAAAGAICLPLLPDTHWPWGPTEYGTLLLVTVTGGLFFGLKNG